MSGEDPAGETNNDTYRPRRIGLRHRNTRHHRQRGSARGQMQKLSAGKVHDALQHCGAAQVERAKCTIVKLRGPPTTRTLPLKMNWEFGTLPPAALKAITRVKYQQNSTGGRDLGIG